MDAACWRAPFRRGLHRWAGVAIFALLVLSSFVVKAQSPLLERDVSDSVDQYPSFSPEENDADVSEFAASPIEEPESDTLRIAKLEAQLRALRQTLVATELATVGLQATPPAPKPKEPAKAATLPTYPVVKLTGFFQADAAWIQQDANSLTQFGDIEDDRGFRRARLAATGDVTKNVSYLLELDFAQAGRPSFLDVWLELHDVQWLGNVRVGHFRQPFGMDALTSVRELTFFERNLPFSLDPFRQVGVGFHDTNKDETVTWAASGFGFPTDPFGDSTGDSGYGFASRVTALPLSSKDGSRLLHVGVDYAYVAPTNDSLRYRNTPEYGGQFAGPTGTAGNIPAFVDTGVMSASNANLFAVELAGVSGSFHAQSELTYSVVDLNGGGNVTFPGYYAQAAYILSGEVRPYNKAVGVLGRIKPKCPWGPDGWGAFEVATRYSYLNLNPGGIGGGRLNNYTTGLNWYLNNNTKFQFNYIISDQNGAIGGDSITRLYALRAQVDF